MKETTVLEAKDWDSDGTRTPVELFDELNARYHFRRDLFASKENAKLPLFF